MSTQDRAVLEAVRLSGKSTLDRATAKAKEKFDQLLNITLNIAVTGRTGTGKSSFVNVIRQLSDDDEGAAPTGVTETTVEPVMYTHLTAPNVNIWDLPGIGSPNFKANKYLKEIDNDISSEQKKKGFNEQRVLDEIRKECQKNLKEMEDSKVFLISSAKFWKYDFEMLKNTLSEELPAHKRYALLQAWPVCSTACLEKKIMLFKGLSWAVSLVSAGVAVAPVPGVGSAAAAGLSFASTQYILREGVNELAATAREITRIAGLDKIPQDPLLCTFCMSLLSDTLSSVNGSPPNELMI
ncbi:Interferon-inducible GTPase 5 [Labeo rohita]|uniref:Interferon-inducible GTPase 5 n=1 Tax=Labeo rohita TaxID=84645 RepID=A0ABQ8L0T7_LABRO|nr:Interferon-inducible GTPase 5 [Labeo rohita]